MHYVFVCGDMIHKNNILFRVRTKIEQQFFISFFIRVCFMKSIVFMLAFVAMSTSLFAQHQVLGQSPRSAKIYNVEKEHIVLGQSPRSAKIYNSDYVPVAKVEEVKEEKTAHVVLGQSPRSAKIYNSDYVPVAKVEEVKEEKTAQVVLGQSPRSAKIYNVVKEHIVLGQSPRSAKIYNTRALQGVMGMLSKPIVSMNVHTNE